MFSVCGFQSVTPALVSMFFYMETPYAVLTDLYFFELNLSSWQIIGCVIVILCSVASMIEEHQQNKLEAAKKLAQEGKVVDLKDDEF